MPLQLPVCHAFFNTLPENEHTHNAAHKISGKIQEFLSAEIERTEGTCHGVPFTLRDFQTFDTFIYLEK